MKNKKGQMGGLEDAPGIIMIVGLVFLTMATMALISEKYGSALDTEDVQLTVTNESSWANLTGDTVSAIDREGFFNSQIVRAYNATGGTLLNSTQVTLSSAGAVTNGTNTQYPTILITYTYFATVETSASNVTTDLNTEIANNTSIAGIILTISLIGIVLTILIGVFLRSQNRI